MAVKLIFGFYKAQNGAVLLIGVNSKDAKVSGRPSRALDCFGEI
jgi:hypothetical protein